MADPYRMVVVNITASFVLLFGIWFYKYIYPKRKINLLILLILISVLVCISIYRNGVYESGDFNIHIYRTIEFYNSLKDGQFIPSWAGGLNATYGYPLFIFNYPLPYYLISFFHFLGFSFIMSMKLLLTMSFILSGVFMYLFAKNVLKNNLAAFMTAIFYLFAPYHLIDLHFKVVIGEILIFTILPLTFYFFQKLWKEKSGLWLTLSSISIALLIMSHVVIAFFSMALIFSYAIFQYFRFKQNKYIFNTLISLIIGSICSVYVWLTPFFMSQYTILKDVYNNPYFPQFWELLFSPWRIGFLFQGHKGELSFLLGYAHILIIIELVILFVRKRLISKYLASITYWFIALFFIIFLIIPYSKIFWGIIPFLQITGSHRLLLLSAFVTSIIAGYVALHFLKKQIFIYALIFFTIFSTILNWGQRRIIPEITDKTLIKDAWKSTSRGEGHFYANSKYRDMNDPWLDKLPYKHMEIIKGIGNIKEIRRISTDHVYVVDAKTSLVVRENTLYFPGWEIYSDNKLIQTEHDKEGVVIFDIPEGLHYIEVRYSDILIYKFLKIISFSGFFVLIGYLIILVLQKLKSVTRVYGR